MWSKDMEGVPRDGRDIILYFPQLIVSGPYIICNYAYGQWENSSTGSTMIPTPKKWCPIPEGAE